jgi:phosphatidylinositol glycan class O
LNPITSQTEPRKVQLQIIGFANAIGSSFLLFATVFFALVWASTQLTGQAVLALGAICMMAWLEIVDSLRDLRKDEIIIRLKDNPTHREPDLQAKLTATDQTRFSDTLPFCLLALQLFYGTGHQSTLQSLQWKTAFLLTEKLVYPFSPLLVMINTFGPLTFIGLSLPLLSAWNITPTPYAEKLKTVEREALRACLAAMAYFGCLLLGSAASAAWLRRHLMVWKVFAPRFMAGAAGLVALDLGVALGLLWGLPVVFSKVETFATKVSGKI